MSTESFRSQVKVVLHHSAALSLEAMTTSYCGRCTAFTHRRPPGMQLWSMSADVARGEVSAIRSSLVKRGRARAFARAQQRKGSGAQYTHWKNRARPEPLHVHRPCPCSCFARFLKCSRVRNMTCSSTCYKRGVKATTSKHEAEQFRI